MFVGILLRDSARDFDAHAIAGFRNQLARGPKTIGSHLKHQTILRGDGNRKSNLLPIHVSRRQSRPSRLCADFVLLILTSPVKREFFFYDFSCFYVILPAMFCT